jgi:hypothetical protein
MAPRPGAASPPSKLRATFRTPEAAAEATRRLQEQGIAAEDIAIDATDDRQHMLVRQQQAETNDAKHVAVDLMSPAQAKGALLLAPIGAVAGAVIVGALGLFMTLGDFSRPASIGIFAIVGALAGSTMGFVYGGGRGPEVAGELHDPAADTTVTVTTSDPDKAAAAIRTIDSSGATDAEYETNRDDPLAGGRRPTHEGDRP